MRLIKRITDSDFMGGAPVWIDKVSRYGSRGVLVDGEMNVAMMYMAKTKLYKLPGGGVDEGEDRQAAFLREIKEETGYEAEIVHELGYIEEHKNRNQFMQYSYCFIAKACKKGVTMLSENEARLGMETRWMPLDQALEAMNNSARNCEEYSAKFMILRDKTILEKAMEFFSTKL
ncbi:NUDIX domain-containing protein [Paenibacillus doosanensis]|uniref:RNA pyrophosphohydrolase n=1 Tax=Paenibacillus konkukensis TaxID=2020716 RepID=A0ABY4RPD9_9BACL|nr:MULTISPECIES: NUDIX domain-containing protein [Paenibacillus]MCS7461744.1 NUDIX domain-containing protein [Paenibacillus doosanensis]UQZ83584.1 RNA pyrophosphohydrolase [Paenibacillus konkukensis]